MNGILNLDKPAGLSSARAVARVKRLLPRGAKIGHAGTLDPFATGVLLLLIGKATRSCETLMGQPKQYEATVHLGATTATDDPESEPVPWPAPIVKPTVEQIHAAIALQIGTVMQRPPAFSALKVGGRRAYDLARKGADVALAPRSVRIDSIKVLEYAWPTLRLRIDSGRGVYVRAIARDLGEALNVGGYLTTLRRTRIGDFRVEDATGLEGLTLELLVSRLTAIG